MSTATPVISFNNLRKSYGSLEVLRGITASLYKGDVASIIGTSGCGKSTLLRCCNRLETINGGELNVIGLDLSKPDISSSKLKQLRTKVGMVFQQFNLFPHLSVLQNLTLAPAQVLQETKAECRDSRFTLFRQSRAGKQSQCLPRTAIGRAKTAGSDRS